MTPLAWAFLVAFVVAGVLFALMSSKAIRLASRLNDAERSLRTSRQAHALDVAALTKKLVIKSHNPEGTAPG